MGGRLTVRRCAVSWPVNSRAGGTRTAEFVRVNPKQKVPVLLIDGEPLTENIAIQVWISRRFPSARLLPTGGDEIRALSAVQSMPYVLVTRSPEIKSIRDFTDKDRIALPAVKLTGHAIALQMAAAREWGREHYDKLDAITLSMSHPDATAALLAGKSEINAHFASSPFYYIELATPGVHKVLHSYEVAGGRHTNGVLMASKKFYDANPKVCAAVVAALDEANAFIKANPRKAAEIYIAMTKEKRSTLDEMEKMVSDPDVDYTTTPINVMKFVEFMNLAGTVKRKPSSWKDLFFPSAYAMPGS